MAGDIDSVAGQANVRHVGGAGPFLRGTLRFADGPNVTWDVTDDAPGDEVEVSIITPPLTGPPGPTGGSGGPGPNGGPGPAGPGFNVYNSFNQVRAVTLNPGTLSLFFGTGFNWLHAGAALNLNQTATGHVGIGILSVSGVGTATINVQIEEVSGLVPGQTARVNADAAG